MSAHLIHIPDYGDGFHQMWAELIRLKKATAVPWILIGAQMVALHGWAKGRQQIRQSTDADLLINVRALSAASRRISSELLASGFEFDGHSPDGTGHRFRKATVAFDLLGPDGLGSRANLTTVGSARAVQVPGGTQALKRAEEFEISSRSIVGDMAVPNLLGAILIKSRAVNVHSQPKAQLADLAFLLTLVDDPDSLAADMSSNERSWLRRHLMLSDARNPIWEGLAFSEDGAIAYRRLTLPRSSGGAGPSRR